MTSQGTVDRYQMRWQVVCVVTIKSRPVYKLLIGIYLGSTGQEKCSVVLLWVIKSWKFRKSLDKISKDCHYAWQICQKNTIICLFHYPFHKEKRNLYTKLCMKRENFNIIFKKKYQCYIQYWLSFFALQGRKPNHWPRPFFVYVYISQRHLVSFVRYFEFKLNSNYSQNLDSTTRYLKLDRLYSRTFVSYFQFKLQARTRYLNLDRCYGRTLYF